MSSKYQFWHVTPAHTYTEGERNRLMWHKENSKLFGQPIYAPMKGQFWYICPNQGVEITRKPISLHMKEGNMHREISL